jgi:hypothetical protein
MTRVDEARKPRPPGTQCSWPRCLHARVYDLRWETPLRGWGTAEVGACGRHYGQPKASWEAAKQGEDRCTRL